MDKIVNMIVLKQIDQEREGEQIDRALLKNVLDIFVEIGMGQMDYYENDFEAAMLKDTAAYYSRKAANWILDDSCPDYMLKVNWTCSVNESKRIFALMKWFLMQIVSNASCWWFQAEECLMREKDRVSHYLHSSSEPKLLEVCGWFYAVTLCFSCSLVVVIHTKY